MYKNTPWLAARIPFIISTIFDLILFIIVNFYYSKNFIVENNKIIFSHFIFILWYIFSYIVGRYHLSYTTKFKSISKNLLLTSTSLVLVLLFFYIWISLSSIFIQANISSIRYTFRFIIIFSILSLSSQFIINILFFRSNLKSRVCFFISNEEDLNKIKFELKDEITNIEIRRVNSIKEISKEMCNPSNTIISIDKYNLDKNIKKIIKYKNLRVLSKIRWMEETLQRLPPTLINKNDLKDIIFQYSQYKTQLTLKRIFDFLFSILLIIFSFPFLSLAALLIVLEDQGPIFYSQIRSGQFGNHIKIYKLRTMKINAESSGPIWAKKKDPRITKIGRILRRTRLDELPQLLSVIKGDMSLIGPRPERPEFDENLKLKIPYYSLRFQSKPGLSGWAQVNYPYGASLQDTYNKLSYDLYYIKNFSFLLDLLIFFKTIRLVFRAQGAIPKK